MNIKEQYTKESEKLAGITREDQTKNLKQQFQSKKSRSFKEKRGLKFKTPKTSGESFKEDAIFSFKNSTTSLRNLIVKKPVVVINNDSVIKEKTDSLKNSDSSANTTPTLGGLKSLNFSALPGIFQNNSNHMSQRSLFAMSRANPSGLDVFREKINNAANQDLKSKNKENLLETVLEKEKSRKGHNMAINVKDLTSQSSSKKDRLSIVKESNNAYPMTPVLETDIQRQNPRKEPKTGLRRTSSMDLFNKLHNDDEYNFPLARYLETTSYQFNNIYLDFQHTISMKITP